MANKSVLVLAVVLSAACSNPSKPVNLSASAAVYGACPALPSSRARLEAFTPALNYIGRSQCPDPPFNGAIDDFQVHSYALSEAEVATLATGN